MVWGGGWGVDHDTEAVAKSAVTLYANFIHFVFNELISVSEQGVIILIEESDRSKAGGEEEVRCAASELDG